EIVAFTEQNLLTVSAQLVRSSRTVDERLELWVLIREFDGSDRAVVAGLSHIQPLAVRLQIEVVACRHRYFPDAVNRNRIAIKLCLRRKRELRSAFQLHRVNLRLAIEAWHRCAKSPRRSR